MAAAVAPGTPAPAVEAPITADPSVEQATTETDLSDDAEAREAQALAELTGKTAEKKTEPKAEEKPKEEPIPSIEEQSRSFAALKHKTKRFEAEREAFAAEKTKQDTTHSERMTALEKREAEFNARVERAAKTPLEALKELGWTPEQLLKYVGDNGEIPQERLYETLEKKFQAKLDEIKSETEKQTKEREAREAEAKKARDSEAVAGFERRVGEEIVEIVSDAAEAAKFPQLRKLLRTTKGARMVHRGVLNQLAEAYTKTKKPLAISDALIQAEKEAAELFDDGSDPQQAGAVQPANPGSIEPIPKLDTVKRGVAPKKELDELTAEEREELALRELRGAG